MDKNISYSCATNVRTLHIYVIIRIFNGCELRIENSVTTVSVQHREAWKKGNGKRKKRAVKRSNTSLKDLSKL